MIQNQTINFNYEDFLIRVVTLDNGEPGFVAKDIANVLEIQNVSQMIQGLDDNEYLIYTLHISGQNRDVIILTEPGLYLVLIRSNKPQAKPFRRWVTHEVLPSIRKTGYYSVEGDSGDARQPMYKFESMRRRAEDDNALELMLRKRKQGLMEIGFDKSAAILKAIRSIIKDTGVDLSKRWDFDAEELRDIGISDPPEKSTPSKPDALHTELPSTPTNNTTNPVPKNYRGYNLNKRGKNKKGEPLFNLVRKVKGKKEQKYLGVWDQKKADQIIDAMNQEKDE